jgi:organic hydroperoxide reductase OsmC/OhrA
MKRVHEYEASCSWRGSTATGYESYERSHQAAAFPARTTLDLSSDPAFHGNAERLNPEQLLLMAASSCQLLSFLAVCARARIDVRQYEDHATALMPEGNRPVRLTTIVLRPKIEVAKGPTEERVRNLVQVAHEECYVANSLNSDVRVEPEIRFI